MACVKAQYNSSDASLGHFIMTLVNLQSPLILTNFIFNFIQFKGKPCDQIIKSVNLTPANG